MGYKKDRKSLKDCIWKSKYAKWKNNFYSPIF